MLYPTLKWTGSSSSAQTQRQIPSPWLKSVVLRASRCPLPLGYPCQVASLHPCDVPSKAFPGLLWGLTSSSPGSSGYPHSLSFPSSCNLPFTHLLLFMLPCRASGTSGLPALHPQSILGQVWWGVTAQLLGGLPEWAADVLKLLQLVPPHSIPGLGGHANGLHDVPGWAPMAPTCNNCSRQSEGSNPSPSQTQANKASQWTSCAEPGLCTIPTSPRTAYFTGAS